MKRPLVLAVLCLVASTLTASVTAGDDWKKTFKTNFASKNSWEKADALKALNPGEKDQLAELLKVADKGDWFLRSTVASILSNNSAKCVDELRKQLKTGSPNLAEVAATALGGAQVKDALDDLVETLKKSKELQVRRACVIALGRIPDKKGVALLVEIAEKEQKNPLLFVHVQEALERATGERDKYLPAEWKGWWTGAEGDFGTDKAKKGDGGSQAEDIHTVSKGTDIRLTSRGKGRVLLVLPDSELSKGYLTTYLRELELTNQVLYLDLPAIADFKNPAVTGNPLPTYPVDRLVDAFNEMRQTLVKDKRIEDRPIAILGHNLSGLVALRFAAKYPKVVARLIVVTMCSGDRSFSKSLDAMERQAQTTDDRELEHFAQHCQWMGNGPKYSPAGTDEKAALKRKDFTAKFAQWQNLEIGRLLGNVIDEGDGSHEGQRPNNDQNFFPSFDAPKEPDIAAPVLFVAGDRAFFGGPDDAAELSKHYSKSKVEVMKGCAEMPFVEDPRHFLDAVQRFLK